MSVNIVYIRVNTFAGLHFIDNRSLRLLCILGAVAVSDASFARVVLFQGAS